MERKYYPLMVFFILSLAIMGVLFTFGGLYFVGIEIFDLETISSFLIILPGDIFTDIPLVYVLPIIIFFIFFLLSSFFAIFYIKLHKFFYWILRRPSKYGVVQLGKKVKLGRIFYRCLIIGLFTFSLVTLVVEFGYGGYFTFPDIESEVRTIALQTLMGSMFVSGISILVFFPFWFLEDSGIVSYRVFPEERLPIDIEGVHSIYHNMLIGYAGISTILSWILISSDMIATYVPGDPILIAVIALIFLPFIIAGLLAIPIYLYERFLPRMLKRLKPHVEKMNFREMRVPPFEEM